MNDQSISAPQKNNQTDNIEDIDLMVFVGALIERKFFLIIVTLLFVLVGVVYARYIQPIYQVNSIIQVESSGSSVPGLADVSGMFESSSNSSAEIELLKSRSIIGEAAAALRLDIITEPKLFPYIGERAFRTFSATAVNQFAEPKFGASSYAWGGEQINVFKFNVPQSAIGHTFTLVAGNDQHITLKNSSGDEILTGKVGEELTNGKFSLTLRTLKARAGTEILLTRANLLGITLNLQNAVSAKEKGKNTGIIALQMNSGNIAYAQKVIDQVAKIYVRRNVERNSAEAKSSLEFLRGQLPIIKKQLEVAENKYNNYKIKQQSVDISMETQSILNRVVTLDTKLQNFELQRLELTRKFKVEHPIYQGLIEKITEIKKQKELLLEEIGNLPATQQQLLSLRRDVEVNNQIYMLLLGKAQQLDIIRAGTVGNVLIIDRAELNTAGTVNPKKSIVVAIFTLLGGFLAIVIVVLQKVMNKGIEDPAEIEAIGLTVYASVPYSDSQAKLSALDKISKKGKVNKADKAQTILALDNPADLAIEALRSLRTSLHFAMIKAKNNVIAISGPSPGVGKSFISINLAALLAQSDKKVLVVDADMRKGYIHSELGLQWEHGLSDYLSDRLNLAEVTKTTSIAGLSLVTRGQIPPNPSELLMHGKFSQFIAEVSGLYDLVIIDTPPILAVTDPAIVSAHAGTSLLVTRFGQNHLREIELTRNRFRQNDIDIKGIVFNCVVKKAGNAYGYYSYAYKSEK
jgi:tyrosine-protein kinase Etk/Wzc